MSDLTPDEIVRRASMMGLCSQTYHEHLMRDAATVRKATLDAERAGVTLTQSQPDAALRLFDQLAAIYGQDRGPDGMEPTTHGMWADTRRAIALRSTPAAPAVDPKAKVPQGDPSTPMEWALMLVGALTVKDDEGNLCTMVMGQRNGVAERLTRQLARSTPAAHLDWSNGTDNCRTCDLTYPKGTEHRCTDGWSLRSTPAAQKEADRG